MAKTYKRETRYPKSVSANLTVELHAALVEVAERFDMSPGWVAREAIARGLPLVKETLRKAARGEARRKTASE